MEARVPKRRPERADFTGGAAWGVDRVDIPDSSGLSAPWKDNRVPLGGSKLGMKGPRG
jgi:hypothetical protein